MKQLLAFILIAQLPFNILELQNPSVQSSYLSPRTERTANPFGLDALTLEFVNGDTVESLNEKIEALFKKQPTRLAKIKNGLTQFYAITNNHEQVAIRKIALALEHNDLDPKILFSSLAQLLRTKDFTVGDDPKKDDHNRFLFLKIALETTRHNISFQSTSSTMRDLIKNQNGELKPLLFLAVTLAQNGINPHEALFTLKYFLDSKTIRLEPSSKTETIKLSMGLAKQGIDPHNILSWLHYNVGEERSFSALYELTLSIANNGIDPEETMKKFYNIYKELGPENKEELTDLVRSLSNKGINPFHSLNFLTSASLEKEKKTWSKALLNLKESTLRLESEGFDTNKLYFELSTFFRNNKIIRMYNSTIQNFIFTDSPVAQRMYLALPKTQKLFDELNVHDFALGTQSYIKLLILEKVMAQQADIVFLAHLKEVVLPGLRVMEAITKKHLTLGIGFPRSSEDEKSKDNMVGFITIIAPKSEEDRDKDRQADIEMLLTNFLSVVQNDMDLGVSQRTSGNSYQLRTLPTSYPILALFIQKLHSIGVIEDFQNYTTKMSGDHIDELPFLYSALFHNMIPQTITPGTLQPDNIGESYSASIHFPIIEKLVGGSIDPWDPTIEGKKTHLFHNMLSPRETGIKNGVSLILQDLRRTFALVMASTELYKEEPNQDLKKIYLEMKEELIKTIRDSSIKGDIIKTLKAERMSMEYARVYDHTKSLLISIATYFSRNARDYKEFQQKTNEFVVKIEELLLPSSELEGEIVRLGIQGDFNQIRTLLRAKKGIVPTAGYLLSVASYPKESLSKKAASNFGTLHTLPLIDLFRPTPISLSL